MEKTLPINWVETELGNYSFLKNGYAFKSNDFKDTGIPVIRISNIKDSKIDLLNAACVDKLLFKPEFTIEKGDILIAMSGATTGKYGIYLSDDIALQNQRVGNLKPIIDELANKKFIYYLLANIKPIIEELAYGGAQPNISPQLIETIQIPLPPLPEQERIVNKLDALFTQLDGIRSAMERIPSLLKNFRQQVLTQAVTGKLTEEWREYKELDEWRVEKIENLVDKISDGPFGSNLKTSDYSSHGVRVIRLENIGELQFNEEYRSFVSNEKYETIKKHTVKKGDIIFSSFISEKVRTVILPDHIDKAVNKADCFLIRTNEKVFNRTCLVYFLSTRLIYDQLTKNIHGSTRPRINTTQLKQALIPFPPLLEQQEIARRIEILFSRADAIEQQYQNLKQKIDNLPQSILHKAFKGELVEQFPTDGDARDLLRQIEELKQLTKKKK